MRQQRTFAAVTMSFVWLLCGCAGASRDAQSEPAVPDPEEVTLLDLAADLNSAVESGNARGVRRLLYVPKNDYDFAGMQRYLEQVAVGKFKDWDFTVLHAEIEGDYAAVIISQKAPGGANGEITPVAMFKPGVRWRILPFDLRKDHPAIGGEAADAAYARLLKRAGDWVRANSDVRGRGGPGRAPAQQR